MSVVGKLLELLAPKNDLSRVVEDLLNFFRCVLLVFQHQRIERFGFVDLFLAGSACHAMIGIRAAPTFQLRIAGDVAVDRADDAHFLIAGEIGNCLPHRHDLLSAFDVELAVVQDEVALRVDVVENCLISFHQRLEMFRLMLAAIVALELQSQVVDVELGLQQMAHVGEHSIAIRVRRDHCVR